MFFHEEQYIKDVITYIGNKPDDSSQYQNIAYGTDKNFLFGCAVSITSFLINNSELKFNFHVFTDSFSESDREKFKALAEQYKTNISIYLVNADSLKSLPENKLWTYAIYFRFIIADYFSGKLERIAYIDSDVVCNGSIQELVHLPLNGAVVAAVTERDEKWWLQRAEVLGNNLIAKGYFNTGVLVIDLAEWQALDVSMQAMKSLNDSDIRSKLTYYDQDVLNIILAGRVLFLDKKYNTQFSLNYELKKNCKSPVDENTVLIHYIGPTKPWHEWAQYETTALFIKAKKMSPWCDDKLMLPTNTSQNRYGAKHSFHQGLYLKGIRFYIKYFLLKIKG
ncbi:lipopolysaccharide 3-alpha-galactosyltransferase [Obesumbacterium proteus]|uniref:UDP-glucose:(Glucosyl)lipopolysaccharide alpha-1,3-glucosyltransferase n=1 Tax=Obesumbacterium proteus ATCC 12841 TaxID=1354268 RepID=A0AA91EH90_9GAMM|nr:lipopolysaccharide 3-alpha-galactosyltransferase [Obesumbacterium proteus]AMO80141.1 lipopolysaccharide 1,3-galactosyltransferase [Obesumbacterium proteus]OAT58637.1 UDP-glucose:(glucosyl)lipopolysaccharide alpha-1,3-glucosyltransferase [Obesumbacterium proteus ATCC 12841]